MEAHSLTSVIDTLDEAARMLREKAARFEQSDNLTHADRRAVLASLNALSTRIESYGTYLEDCRIMLESEQVTPSTF